MPTRNGRKGVSIDNPIARKLLMMNCLRKGPAYDIRRRNMR